MRQTSSRRPADLSEAIAVGEFLIADPRICHGKLTFKGTRLPVQTVLTLLAKKQRTIDYVLESWPHLCREAVEEAVRLAAVAWPELMEPDVVEALEQLATSLKQGKGQAEKAHEPAHPGRTACRASCPAAVAPLDFRADDSRASAKRADP